MNRKHTLISRGLAAAAAWGVWALAGAQGVPATAGIYTCVDARGRTLTSDRPIPECMDRTQKELNPSGTVKRQVPPPLTAQEAARQEEEQRAAAEEQARRAEEKRKDRALVLRYPSQAPHDRDRREALAGVDAMILIAQNNLSDLVAVRKQIDLEMEFYTKDPSQAPSALRRQLDDNTRRMQERRRQISDQQLEKTRINRRFDDELARLRQLWGAPATPGTASSTR